MKRFSRTLVAVMVVAATVAAILVGCKKEEKTGTLVEKTGEAYTFDASQIEDMNTYLFEFKHNMQESKSVELLDLAEAQWHLTALANYDFAYANKEGNSFQIDTIYGSINMTDGKVAMSDLNSFYTQLSENIVSHYHEMTFENKNYRCMYSEFLDDNMDNDLQVLTVLVTSYTDPSRLYFFENDSILYQLFPNNTWYSVGNDAIRLLNRYINVYFPVPNGFWTQRLYFTGIVHKLFVPTDYPDENSPCGYRMFIHLNPVPSFLSAAEMRYYLDSYLGLIRSYAPMGRVPLSNDTYFDYENGYTFYSMNVTYGYPTATEAPPQL